MRLSRPCDLLVLLQQTVFEVKKINTEDEKIRVHFFFRENERYLVEFKTEWSFVRDV